MLAKQEQEWVKSFGDAFAQAEQKPEPYQGTVWAVCDQRGIHAIFSDEAAADLYTGARTYTYPSLRKTAWTLNKAPEGARTDEQAGLGSDPAGQFGQKRIG